MITGQTITFQNIIEKVESLPEQQQEALIEIIKKRLLENRRESLVKILSRLKRNIVKVK